MLELGGNYHALFPEDMEWLEANWDVVEALGATPEVLGRGVYGMVLQTYDDGIIKITASDDEARAIQYVQDLRTDLGCGVHNCDNCLPGLPFSEGVWQIPENLDVEDADFRYIVLREDVIPLMTHEREEWNNVLIKKHKIPELPQWWDACNEAEQALLQDILEDNISRRTPVYDAYELVGGYLVDVGWEPLLEHVMQQILTVLRQYPYKDISVLGETLTELWNTYDIYLSDMHGDNVGRAGSYLCRDRPAIVFFDYMILDIEKPEGLRTLHNPSGKLLPPPERPIPLLPV